MRVLINTPDTSKAGGVANHYRGLKAYWSCSVRYNFVGGRKGIPGPVCLCYDYFKFLFLCISGRFDVVLLNPSLSNNAIRRDSLFLRISRLVNVKTVVFFHGWSSDMVDKLNQDSRKFAQQFNRAERIVVLAESFKRDLINWGISRPIYLSSTKVDDHLIERFRFDKKEWRPNILFLARIEVYKGIFIALEAFRQVKDVYPNATLTVAGDGSQFSKVKNFVRENQLQGVNFLGNVSGLSLVEAFSNACIYLLPSYSEGMPTSVLEAMAFGLPIISRPVGGLVDFFKENRMGHLIQSLNPEDYAAKIMCLLEDPDLCLEIGKYNHSYASNHFVASKVALKLEEFLNS